MGSYDYTIASMTVAGDGTNKIRFDSVFSEFDLRVWIIYIRVSAK